MANTYSLDLEDGSSQYAKITDASQSGLDVTGDLTVEGWVKPESLTTSHTLLSKYGGSGARSYIFSYTSGQIIFRISSTGVGTFAAAPLVTISTGTFVHLAASFNATTKLVKIYMNSIEQTSLDSGFTSIFNGGADFRVGADGAGGLLADGLVDEIRVWSEERTQTQIADNYQKELVGNEANLEGYWKFENNYVDETSNGNDLTAVNSPTFSTDVPFTAITFAIAEVLGLVESTTFLRGRLFTAADSLGLIEGVSFLKGISFQIAESIGLTEAYNISMTHLFAISESIGLTEVTARVFSKWRNVARNVTTWATGSKNTSTWTNDTKS